MCGGGEPSDLCFAPGKWVAHQLALSAWRAIGWRIGVIPDGEDQRMQPLAPPHLAQPARIIFVVGDKCVGRLEIREVEPALFGCFEHVTNWRIVGGVADAQDRKSTRLNSSHYGAPRMSSSD